MKNVIEQILDENNHEIIRIKGNHHETFQFEQIALLELEEVYYTILHPLAEDVGPDDVLIFRIDRMGDEAQLVLEEDEDILKECLNSYEQLYQEKKKKQLKK